MNALSSLLLVLMVSGCDSGSSAVAGSDARGEERLPVSMASTYDASRLPPIKSGQENLLTNGSFEEEEGWVLCGSSGIESSPQAQDGNKFLELSTEGKCFYDDDSLSQVHGNAYHALNIETMPEEIFVSFYARSSSPIELLDENWGVSLLSDFQGNGDFGRSVAFSNIYGYKVSSNWTLINMSLTRAEIEEYLGELVPKWLYFVTSSRFDTGSNVSISFDNVRVSYEKEVIQAEPMPESLQNYSGDEIILFTNLEKKVAATVKPNGSSFVSYENIPTELVSSLAWYAGNKILIGKTVFSPFPNNDPQVIPNSRTQLYRHDLTTGKEVLFYETLGNPGRYEYDDSPNNLYALDLEVRRIAWDALGEQGALTICGRNKDIAYYVSDDYCEIQIIDANGRETGSIKGFNAVWSSSGSIAFFDGNALLVADVSEVGIDNARVVYESITGLPGAVDWLPGGNSLVFMENGSDVVGDDYAKVIKMLDLSSGALKELLIINQGSAYPNLSWSKNSSFIVYSIFIPTEEDPAVGNNQVWWLEVATGKTGPITNTVNGYGATFSR